MMDALPEKFKSLERFVAEWALPTHHERWRRRHRATPEELRIFYDAVLPQMEDILAEADRHPLGQMPEDVERLFFLALSLAEIAPHIELYGGKPYVPHSFAESRMIAVQGDLRG